MTKTIDSTSLKTELLDIQRWENEGGQINEHHGLMNDQLLVRPPSINTRGNDRSLQWNERFVIKPLKPGQGIYLIGKKHTAKPDGP